MDPLKLSWFFLYSTVVSNNDQQHQQHQQQTPTFIPRHQATSIMADPSKLKVAASKVAPQPPPPGAVFGGHAHAGHAASSRPAFLSPPATYHQSSQYTSPDARDETGIRPTSSTGTMYPYYMYSPPATLGVAAEFLPPHSTLRTVPSHDSNDDHVNAPMPDLPSVPPSSSIHHVSFAPPATYQTHEYDPRIEYRYETYAYPPEPTPAGYRQYAESDENIGDSSSSYTSYDDITVPNEEVTDRDVKFGRGGGTNRHPGNLYFRKLVEDAKPAYLFSKKTMKGEISHSIVSAVRSQGGRWLKLNDHSGLWEDVGNEEAAKKVSQALREGLALKRREALIASVSTDGSRSKKSIAHPKYLPITKAKCKAKGM